MSRITRLTPDLLKQIIKEEKDKLKTQSVAKVKTRLSESDLTNLRKLVMQEKRLRKRLNEVKQKKLALKNKILKK